MFYIKLCLLFLWQLPQNIIALIMCPFLGEKELIVFQDYCWAFKCSKMEGGISLGNFIFLSKSHAKKETSILHEYGHTKQSHILGFLYLIIIGIPSLLNAMFGFTKCYYSWYTEKWANKLAKLKVGVNQYGCFLYIENK